MNLALMSRRFSILFIAFVKNLLTFINNLLDSFSVFKYSFYYYDFSISLDIFSLIIKDLFYKIYLFFIRLEIKSLL